MDVGLHEQPAHVLDVPEEPDVVGEAAAQRARGERAQVALGRWPTCEEQAHVLPPSHERRDGVDQ